MSHIKQFQHLKIKLEDIQSATNNFSDENCIGHGGFGKVYKAVVVHSKGQTMAALKRLDRAFGQGNPEFWKEIMMLSFYRHENIVSLLGYCDDYGEKILVYDYASKRSLDWYLATPDLSWVQRLKICIGVARGLAYLHTPADTQLRIIHRDIKSSNILLDDNWNAKISDFGLSKFGPANSQFTYLVSNPVGTHGYIDPLYHETGLLTKESDVYSFGVVLFEVLCGRLCYGNNCRPLAGLGREYCEQNKRSELIYSNIKNQVNGTSLWVFTDIAYKCLRREREERPLMTQIVSALENALAIQEEVDAKATAIANANRAGILNVKILKTHDFRTSKNPFSASNPYLILYIERKGQLHNNYMRTTVKHNGINAEWNEEFTLYVENFHAESLTIVLNNMVSVNKHNFLGMSMIKLIKLTPGIPWNTHLDVGGSYLNDIGQVKFQYLTVEVLYRPFAHEHIPANIEDLVLSPIQKAPTGTPKDGGLLVVIIHYSNIYNEVLLDQAHTYVSLLFRGENRKTQSMTNTNDPIWLQEFAFMLEQAPTNEILYLEVIDNSWTGLIAGLIPGKGQGSYGHVNISLTDVINKKRTNELYSLCYPDGRHTLSLLQVELHWRTSD